MFTPKLEMQTEEKKVSANETMIKIVHAINQNKLPVVYELLEAYLKTLSPGGNWHYRLKNVLRDKPMQMKLLSELSNDMKNLIMQNTEATDIVYLDSATDAMLKEVLFDFEHRQVFFSHNLPIRNKILFNGPTGNGKTTIARYIAEMSGLPFVEVKSDSVIASHLGSTSAHIHKIFNSIQESCVLFWDEIDSIGSKRGGSADSAALMENDRMTNSFLTNIDKMSKDVMFIGATNRMESLDTAFLRRFDVKHEIVSPTDEAKDEFAQKLLRYYNIAGGRPMDLERYNSYAQIKEEVVTMARRLVVEKIKSTQ